MTSRSDILNYCLWDISIKLIIKCRSLHCPLTMEMLRDLLGLIFIRAHLMLSCSFASSRLVHAAVVVSVVMSSMYVRIGGRRSPSLVLSPPTTRCPDDDFHGHSEGQRRNCTACHYAYFQALPCCCEVRCCETQLQVLEIGLYQCSDGFWYVEKVEGFPEEFMGN